MNGILLQPIRPPLPFQTPGEEIANSILHGLGTLLAIAGLTLLTLRVQGRLGGRAEGSLALVSYVVYATALIILFLVSTLYHAIGHEGAKRVFRVLDHSAIYLLIAGTYTPFCLIHLKGALGWTLFGIEWVLAAVGIVLQAVNWRFFKKAELWVYILMGWSIIAGWPRLAKTLSFAGLALLFSGGLAYTLGTIWYTRANRRGAHVIWHVFVLAGAVCQWWSLWLMS
jgi:hemolysin III